MAALMHAAIVLLLGIGGGLASAWYMVDVGSRLTTRYAGPWQVWMYAGQIRSDPYTRAHTLRSSHLQISGRDGHTFRAITDSDGARLLANCEYVIEGQGPAALWWSVAVYNERGELFGNPAKRYAYSSASVMRSATGHYSIALARNARPGNWLPLTGSDPVVLILRVVAAQAVETSGPGDLNVSALGLPVIKRIGCR